jgi:hypothetical protein
MLAPRLFLDFTDDADVRCDEVQDESCAIAEDCTLAIGPIALGETAVAPVHIMNSTAVNGTVIDISVDEGEAFSLRVLVGGIERPVEQISRDDPVTVFSDEDGQPEPVQVVIEFSYRPLEAGPHEAHLLIESDAANAAQNVDDSFGTTTLSLLGETLE